MLQLVLTGAVMGAEVPVSEISFRGAYQSGGITYVAVTEANGATAGWFPLGHLISGYRLVSVSEDSNTLFLERDGKRFSLQINASVVRPVFVESAKSPGVKVMNREDGLALVKRIFSVENALPVTGNSQPSISVTMKDRDGKPIPLSAENMAVVDEYMNKQGMAMQRDEKGDIFYVAPLTRDTLPPEVTASFTDTDWKSAQKIFLDYIEAIRAKRR